MKNRLKILMAFSEVSPFTKTGGLGDVGGALPKVLKELGHDIRVITPQYRKINERKYVLRDVIRLQGMEIPMGNENITMSVKSAFLPNSKVQVYFMDYRPYFFREGLYVNPKTNIDYPDNAQRFILFNKGILKTLQKLQWQPDVIHCNDWQTALIPFFLKNQHHDAFFSKINTLLTVHNFAFQGNFDPDCMKMMNLSPDFNFDKSDLFWHGQCSFLKAGLMNADCVNTVSERHAKEVMESEAFGFGMSSVLKKRGNKLEGIINGIDYQVWNPETDSLIPHRYSHADLTGKMESRKQLLEDMKLTGLKDAPVVAMISRLTEQKGLHLVEEIFDEMMALPVYFILLGLGEKRFHDFFKKMAHKYPRKFSVQLKFDEILAHHIIAGSDIFLMPSQFEPCGLTQLYALKYGTIPVVFETGGLADTIKPFDNNTSDGTGFTFKKANGTTLMRALKQCTSCYHDSKKWNRIMMNGMKEDFSWEKAAGHYIQLYHQCTGK